MLESDVERNPRRPSTRKSFTLFILWILFFFSSTLPFLCLRNIVSLSVHLSSGKWFLTQAKACDTCPRDEATFYNQTPSGSKWVAQSQLNRSSSTWLKKKNPKTLGILVTYLLSGSDESSMQVSLVCTDHRGGVSRTTEDRLNRQNANSPSTGTRSKFRAVAMVARSLGQLSVQSVPCSSEQSMRTGMKYR